MATIIVTDSQHEFLDEIPGVEVVDSRAYLTNGDWNRRRNIKLCNLSSSYGYQSLGYYVTLLAEARGHRPFPGVVTVMDLEQSQSIGLISKQLQGLIEKSLAPLQSTTFSLSVYFGRNLAERYRDLSRELSSQFQAPLMRFEFSKRSQWRLSSARAIGLNDIPASHRSFVAEQAKRYFSKGSTTKTPKSYRFDLAILHNPGEGDLAPSDEKSLKKMVKAAGEVGIRAELMQQQDSARLLEFDALFIRETTSINHHTYRLARKAEREGLVVIDDPRSILLCTNKVYLAELMERAKIAIPRTVVAHRNNANRVADELGFPLVLKRPDSAFSKGVVKVKSQEELDAKLDQFFLDSELVVAQQFLHTEFDWRIGILDRRPIYACKYHMARGHWQIIKHDSGPRGRFGKCETLPVELAPRKAVTLAQRAADLIGDGLYGVDIKEVDGQFFVIEINDNPNLDSGVEDFVLRDDLYRRLMNSFLQRIERIKSTGTLS